MTPRTFSPAQRTGADPTPQRARRNRLRPGRLGPLLVALLAAGLYVPTLSSEFVWDDRQLIEKNAQIQQMANLPRALLSGFFRDPQLSASYYRPVTTLSTMLDFLGYRESPRGYHLTNLLLHVAVSLLLLGAARCVLRSPWASVLTACLFAAHPVHAESVAWISARTDLLAALFVVPSFWCYVRHCRRPEQRRWRWLSTFALILALLAKETAVVFVLAWLVYGRWVAQRRYREIAGDAGILLLGLGAALGLRLTVSLASLPPQYAVAFGSRALAAALNLLAALRLAYLPGVGQPYHGLAYAAQVPAGWIVASWLLLIAAAVATARLVRRSPLAAVTIVWAALGAWPVLNLVQLPRPMLGERYLYLSTLGACLTYGLLAQALAARGSRWRAATVGIAMVVVAAGAVGTVLGARPWHDGIALWSRVSQCADADPFAKQRSFERAEYHANLSSLLFAAGRFDEAARAAAQSIRIEPMFISGHRAAAMALGALGRDAECLREHEQALRLGPDRPEVHASFGAELLRLRRYDEALARLHDSLKLDANNPTTWRAAGRAYLGLGQVQEAADSFRRAVDLLPSTLAVREELASALLQAGDREGAAAQWSVIVRAGRGGPEAQRAQRQLEQLQIPSPP